MPAQDTSAGIFVNNTDGVEPIPGDLVTVVNCGSLPRRLPAEAGDLLISSGADPTDGRIAPDTAAWFSAA